MANLTGTGIIENITPIGGGKYRISFVEDTFTGINIPSAQVISYQTYANSLVLMDPYINTPNFTYSDFNAIINNASIPRQSNIFWDLDFSTNAIQPVNYQTVITASQQDGNLPKAYVQDYNYQSTPILRRNYLGAKSTSNGFNQLSTEGGFGQLPVVQSEGYYFAFFNWVGGTSPEWGNELEDRSAVNVRYYIGEDGNVIEPINDSNGINLSIVQQNFEQDSNAILSFNDKEGATSQFSNLEGKHKIFKSGQIPQPIIYTQTSSIGSDPTLPNQGGGYTGSIDFVQGDQAPSLLTDDFQLVANASNPYLDYNVGNGNPFHFPSVVSIGAQATSTVNGTKYTVTANPLSNNITISLNANLRVGPGIHQFQSTLQWRKNGTTFIGNSINFNHTGNSGANISIVASDSASTTSDYYELILITFSQPIKNSNNIPTDPPLLLTTTQLQSTQQPLPQTGPCKRFWSKVGNPTNIIEALGASGGDLGLRDFYGQRQSNITGSGFNPITQNFEVQVGDEIRFDGTETQTYFINKVDTTSGLIKLTLDRNITAQDLNYFLHRRYITDPSYLILEVDKPSGGTSTGILTPEYFYGETEKKVDSILKGLTRDNLI